jgi:DNA-binding transcriptional LysR family regulator
MSVVPKALTTLLSTRPAVTASVVSLPSRQIAELVSTGQVDVGIVELPVSRAAITVELLEPGRSVVLMPKKHRLSRKETIQFSDLHEERMVLLSQHSYVRYQIDDALSKVNATPNVVVETPSSLIAGALVSAGLGISIISSWAASSFSGLNVITKPLEDAIPTRVAIIFPEGASVSSLARAFAQEVQNAISAGP